MCLLAARAAVTCKRTLIPGGIQIPGGPQIHVWQPGDASVTLPFSHSTRIGFDVDPGTITDRRGFSAVAYHAGTAIGSDGATYNLETDIRAFEGVYATVPDVPEPLPNWKLSITSTLSTSRTALRPSWLKRTPSSAGSVQNRPEARMPPLKS